MIVGELRHGQIVILDRLRETVRLAEGLSDCGEISADARGRAIDCLSRFGERLRDMQAGSVRAAGTSTLRRAGEESGFMADAEAALGHRIEVISGQEEARLIYGGVISSLPPNEGERLSSGRLLGVLKQQEREPEEVVGVKMADKHNLNVLDRCVALLKMRQCDRRGVE